MEVNYDFDYEPLFQLTNQTPNSIIALWSHSSDNIDFNDNIMVRRYYDSLIRLRHDTFHYVVSKAITGKFENEKRIDEIYPTFDNDTSGLTPDIVYEEDNIIYIIDVGYSKSVYTAHRKKKDKYKLLQLALSQHTNKIVKVIPLILDYKMNLKKCFAKIQHLFKNHINRQLLFDCNRIYVDKLHLLNSYGNAAIISDHAKKKYSGVPVTGYVNDFDCEQEFLQNIIDNKYTNKPNVVNYDEEGFLHEIKKDLETKGSLYNKYKDKKNNINQYDVAYKKMKDENDNFKKKIKPTIPIIYPKLEILKKVSGENSEQEMIFNLCNFINDNQVEDESFYYDFLKEISINIRKNQNNTVFLNGFMNGAFCDQTKEKYKDQYNKYVDTFYTLLKNGERGKRKKKDKIMNYREFLIAENIIEEENFYSTHTKTIRFVKKHMSKQFVNCWKKSGVCFLKYSTKEQKKKTSVDFCDKELIDGFLQQLQSRNTSELYKDTIIGLKEFISYTSMSDSAFCQNLKQTAWKEMEPWYEELENTTAFHFGYFNHLVASQLMHYESLSTKPETLHLFNCGIPNFLTIVVGGYNSLNDEAGKPFLSLCLTKKPDDYTEIYGKLIKINIKEDIWLVMTEWRRLPIMKITFLRDSFYSSLASGLNYSTYTTNDKDIDDRFHRFKYQYALKTLISHCTNQQIAEFLLDSRFALMSSFSKYTNIYKLLTEKFQPPYTNALSVWIVDKLFKNLKKITNAMLGPNAILWKPIEYDLLGRTRSSLGGSVNLPSLWGDYTVKNIHEILDEAFIYVHTMKEPSSMFHEQVNALRTIIDFQNKFNNTKNEYKYGDIYQVGDLIEYLKDDGIIGFSHTIVNKSTNHTLSMIKPNYQKIENEVLTEPVSNIVSTKAIIHSIERNIVEQPMSKSYRKKQMKKLVAYINNIKEKEKEKEQDYSDIKDFDIKEIEEGLKKYKLNSESKYYKTKTRQKVWETIIEILEKYPECETVNDLAILLLKDQKAIIEADICIKSQYGAKREFYVVNIGAKALARQVEKTYEALSKITPEEAISIPGDNKLISIQRMLDTAIQTARDGEYKIMYVNGDCTKWSAAETMGSFIAMNDALYGKFSDKFTKLLELTFSAWSDKTINIPLAIYNKVFPLDDKTDFLRTLIGKKQKGINSTHNFLQGMFNYASSFKSVCCSNYTYYLWQKMYPESDLKMYHMEHSDDYVMIILYKAESDFKKFRCFYKMMMRMHGFNDSERKTSCQTLFLEFVSLMSFNGEMLYPQIKKSKEINLNLPCLGYQTDVEAVMSRAGECVRVGCNMSFSYIYNKIHLYCLAEAYSLLPGMLNHFYEKPQSMFEYPIEMFGIPDQYPIFSLLCKGNINNYRLYEYGAPLTKKFINGLFSLSQTIPTELDKQLDTQPEFNRTFYSPRYMYDMENNQIKYIRKKLGLNPEDLIKYWDENKVFRFVKPIKTKYLIPWMKAMFYNRLFSEAYTAVTRTKMTLRISRYVKAKSLALSITSELLTSEKQLKNEELKLQLYTMKEAHTIMLEKLAEVSDIDINEKEIHQLIVKCDANVSAIYSYLETVNLVFGESKFEKLKLSANKTPHKLTWFHIENKANIILQKIFSPEILEEEGRSFISEESLERDVETTKRELISKPIEQMTIIDVQFLFNQLMSNQQTPITMLGYGNTFNALDDFLQVFLENSVFIDNACFVTTSGVSEIKNPFTSKTFFYKDKKATKSLSTQGLETLTLLYSYLKINQKMETDDIKKILKNLKFISNPKKNETKNYKELLRLFTIESRESLNLTLTELKTASFLQKVLLDDADLIIDLTNSIYTYGYQYIKQASYYSGSYHGVTECAFNYLNQKFYFTQEDKNPPILLTLTKNTHINSAAYLVALKLSNLITQREFELQKYDHTLESYKITSKEVPKTVRINNRKKKLQFIYNGFTWVRFNEITKNQKYIPIIKTTGYMPLTQKTFNVNLKYVPKITEEFLVVSLGKMKLFTLPFWDCKQYDCVEVIKDIPINGVYLSDLLKQKLIYKQFKGHTIRAKKWKECHVTFDQFKQMIKNYIPKIPFKTECEYKELDIYELTDKIIKMNENRKKEDEISKQLMLDTMGDFNFGNFSFGDEEENVYQSDENNMVDFFNSDEEEPLDFTGFSYDSYITTKETTQLLEQEEELFTDLEGKVDYELLEEIENPKVEFFDVTSEIDFSKLKFSKPDYIIQPLKLRGMIVKMQRLEPLYCCYIKENFYRKLPNKMIMTMEQLYTTITNITNKMNSLQDDDTMIVLLYELYYLLKNHIIREEEGWITDRHFIINNEKEIMVNYHYVCDKKSENYPRLKEKYKEIKSDDKQALFYIPMTVEKLIQTGRQLVDIKFPRVIKINRKIEKTKEINILEFL